jgi:hypothetical protein
MRTPKLRSTDLTQKEMSATRVCEGPQRRGTGTCGPQVRTILKSCHCSQRDEAAAASSKVCGAAHTSVVNVTGKSYKLGEDGLCDHLDDTLAVLVTGCLLLARGAAGALGMQQSHSQPNMWR